MLELEQITKSFFTSPVTAKLDLREYVGQQPVEVLKGISLKIAAGQSIGILGPSGSGKSTLLNIIGALDRPTTGKIKLSGKDLSQLSDRELSSIRNRDMGFIFQLHHLLPQCTVLENILLPTLPFNKGKSNVQNIKRSKQLLETVGLTDRMNFHPSQLSGGERQRVAVVRALINQPKILLADEPTGALDEENALNLAELLINVQKIENVALLLATHSRALANKMDKIFTLKDGCLINVN